MCEANHGEGEMYTNADSQYWNHCVKYQDNLTTFIQSTQADTSPVLPANCSSTTEASNLIHGKKVPKSREFQCVKCRKCCKNALGLQFHKKNFCKHPRGTTSNQIRVANSGLREQLPTTQRDWMIPKQTNLAAAEMKSSYGHGHGFRETKDGKKL